MNSFIIIINLIIGLKKHRSKKVHKSGVQVTLAWKPFSVC